MDELDVIRQRVDALLHEAQQPDLDAEQRNRITSEIRGLWRRLADAAQRRKIQRVENILH